MHEQCVIDDTLKRTYERVLGDTNINEDERHKPATKKGRRNSAKPKAPTLVWDGIFSAAIIPREAEQNESLTTDENDNDTAADSTNDFETDIKSAGKLLITDLRTHPAAESKEQNVWEEDIVCLGCRRKIK